MTVATILAGRGVRVILAGTDTDFRGEPFGAMGELMAVAEMVDKLQAICVVCGDPACRNQRLLDGKPGAVRLAHDHGRRPRELRGALPALPQGASARTRTRPRSSRARPQRSDAQRRPHRQHRLRQVHRRRAVRALGRHGHRRRPAGARGAGAGQPGAPGHRRSGSASDLLDPDGALDRPALRRRGDGRSRGARRSQPHRAPRGAPAPARERSSTRRGPGATGSW